MEQNYSSDAPLFNPNHDMFNRYPFAKRVSNVIANRKDSSSIVIGIYGAWGEGKTSVLNFVEKEIQDETEAVALKFNPWRFGNEDEMLINFFYELANAVGKNLQTGKEIAGDILEKYLSLPATLIGKADIADGVVSMFSKVDVKGLRDRIEKLLEQEKKRVVILIDDIDRLEKKEIHAIFRLVKLTADIKYTAYVLAFDKNVVSFALQERYGNTDENIGNSFLEKIIQVPLHLPQIDIEDLRNFCFQEIDEVLRETKSNLSQAEASQFTGYFSKGIEPNLKTPRQAKLYANILTFSLPLLKNEVNIVDLMLIEGIRVFIPELYKLIKNDRKIFLNEDNQRFALNNDYEKKENRRNLIEGVLKSYPEETSKQIIDLLCFLFPKLNSTFNNTHYGNDWELKWEENQRICSSNYFQRYFTYAISSRDIPDTAIGNLLEISKTCSVNEIVENIEYIVTVRNVGTFLTKLRRVSKKLTPAQLRKFALSLAKLDSMLPNPEQLFKFMNPFGQGVMFISDCVENLDSVEEKLDLAEEIISNSSLSFAIECLLGFPRDRENHPNPKGFSKEEFKELAVELTKRFSLELNQTEEINIDQYNSFTKLLYIWNEYGDNKQASNFLKNQIDRNNDFVFGLLDAYTSIAYTIGGFDSRKSSFERESYDSIQKIINPDIIINAIDEVYPDLSIDERYPEFLEDISRNEELSRQFKWLHNNIQKNND